MQYDVERIADVECRSCGGLIFFHVKPVASMGGDDASRDDWMAARMLVEDYVDELPEADQAAACYCVVDKEREVEQCKFVAKEVTENWRHHLHHHPNCDAEFDLMSIYEEI